MKAPQSIDVETLRTLTIDAEIQQRKNRAHLSSATVEHYTPQHIIERAHLVMGGIRCDPATPPNNPTNADVFYTQEENGLKQYWPSGVWLNPPYGRNTIDPWVYKLVAHYKDDKEAMSLLPVRTSTGWFQHLLQYAADNNTLLFCWIKGRLTFIGNDEVAPFSSVITYDGPHRKRFINHFNSIGTITRIGDGGVYGSNDS